MKKCITLLLALVMALTLVVPAWAVDLNTTTASTAPDVTVNIVESDPVYKVDVTWQSLEFTYNQGTWNSGSHQYTGGNWTNDRNSANVTVVNHSNVEMWYTAALDSAPQNGVTMTLSGTGAKLNRPVVGEPLDSQKSEFTVTVAVDPTVHDLGRTVKQLTITIYTSDPTTQQ